jgi:hypothetical protein
VLSAGVFLVGMAGVVFFCAQAWIASGPMNNWRINGPLNIFSLPWSDIVGDLLPAILCGAVACGAFIAGSARTGAFAERRHPLIPPPHDRTEM